MVTAYGKLNGHDIEAEVINPGDWWGKTWLIEVGCGFFSVYYVVEADSCQDAIDEFADSDIGKKQIGIDIAVEGGDYGFKVHPGDIICGKKIRRKGYINLKGEFFKEGEEPILSEPYISGQGTYADIDNLMIHGQEGAKVPWPCEYDVDGELVPCDKYEND